MELLLVRHALPVKRVAVDGPADPVLSEAGHAQSKHLAEYLRPERLHAIYASPFRRAVQTAEPLAAMTGLSVGVEPGVAEYDRMSDTYIPVEELKATNDPRWQAMLAGEREVGDETPDEFDARVIDTIERLVANHAGHKIAVVCHGGVINCYLARVLGLASTTGFFYPNYTSIHRVIAARSGERTISTVNETAHLRGTGLPIGVNS
jgi:probable phosphoglycerate mutase